MVDAFVAIRFASTCRREHSGESDKRLGPVAHATRRGGAEGRKVSTLLTVVPGAGKACRSSLHRLPALYDPVPIF